MQKKWHPYRAAQRGGDRYSRPGAYAYRLAWGIPVRAIHSCSPVVENADSISHCVAERNPISCKKHEFFVDKKKPSIHWVSFSYTLGLRPDSRDYQRVSPRSPRGPRPPRSRSRRPPPKPPRRSVRGGLGCDSFTRMGRPSSGCPLSASIAACACSRFGISTKPKPFERPVMRSATTRAEVTSPYAANAALSPSSVVAYARLPT